MNRIRNQLAVSDLRSALLYGGATGRPMHMQLTNLLDELISIIDDPIHGYSPAQLILRLSPFAEMGETARAAAVQAVHDKFVMYSGFLLVSKTKLNEQRKAFEKAISDFLATNLDDVAAVEAHSRVDACAKELIVELRALPRGVCL